MATEITTNMFGFGATDTPEFRANNPNFDMKGYNEYINNREYIIGCFYDEANINGRIMLDRNSGFTKYIEGQSNYVPISGIYYSDFDGRATITLTPSQESKFKMYFKVTANAYYITDDIGSSFKKGTCADFYIY